MELQDVPRSTAALLKGKKMTTIFNGAAGSLHISEPEVFVDNRTRKRSGHMTHALAEFEPGKIIAFNSNCSAYRCSGHSAFGWVDYRYSNDYGQSWSEFHTLPYAQEEFFNGTYTVSVEKAVVCNGIITIFALRNSQYSAICCEPWATTMVLRSHNGGKTWSAPSELCPFPGRVYDAVVRDGVIYVLMFCNSNHVGTKPDDLYRLYCSYDCGETFRQESVVDIGTIGHSYGALQFLPDGKLAAYTNNIHNGYLLSESVSSDLGKSWKRLPDVRLSEGIRNVQISALGGSFVIHGRAYRDAPFGKGQVIYTSKDGLNWDDGILLEPEKISCYYSNFLNFQTPSGEEKLLLQYSDLYNDPSVGKSAVNVMHRFLHLK